MFVNPSSGLNCTVTNPGHQRFIVRPTNVPMTALLTEAETAAYLGVKKETLATWRSTKRYPLPYVKIGKAVRYRSADLETFIASRTVNVRTPPAPSG